MQIPKPRLLAILLSLAAAAAITLGVAPGAQAEPSIPAHGQLIGSFTPQELLAKPTPTPSLTSPLTPSPKTCSTLPAGSAARLAGATTACVQVTPLSGSALQTTHANTTAGADAATCSITSPGQYTYNRLDYCLTDLQVTYTEINEEEPGEILGTAVLTVSSSAVLSATSGQWQESEIVTLTTVSGLVEDLEVGLTASCNAACTATTPNAWAGTELLTEGESASGNVTFQGAPAAGTVSNITTSYDLTVLQPGTIPINENTTWSNPQQVRCDATFPFGVNTSTGCVIAAVRAQLTLSLATYGAAAALYGFAEQDWIDQWGSASNPLQRQPDPAVQQINRTNTCGTGAARPWVDDDVTVPTDSCDEYPFAATYQGGTNGGLCADVYPLLVNGTWQLFEDPNAPAVTFDEPCLRGHVPQAQNSAAGGELGRLATGQRVIDSEKYTVVVTS